MKKAIDMLCVVSIYILIASLVCYALYYRVKKETIDALFYIPMMLNASIFSIKIYTTSKNTILKSPDTPGQIRDPWNSYTVYILFIQPIDFHGSARKGPPSAA